MFSTPYVKVDLNLLEKNLADRAEKLKKYNIRSRPHIKTHKSIEIAQMQMQHGAIGITCAKLSEAEVFASAGFNDILIAYPIVGESKLKRFGKLHKNINIITTVDSLAVAEALNATCEQMNKSVSVLIEINLGENRCGIMLDALKGFAERIRIFKFIKIVGLLTYHGLIYKFKAEDKENIISMVKEERDMLLLGKNMLRDIGIDVSILSAGSSIASYYPEYLHSVTEVRSGNYIYNDINNVRSGVAKIEDCAIRVVSTVVSMPCINCVTIDAGSKTLSSDLSKNVGFGYVVGYENVVISSLNEEHALLTTNNEDFKIGQEIEIIPNHSCVISNLTDKVYGFRDGKFEKIINIDARGCTN